MKKTNFYFKKNLIRTKKGCIFAKSNETRSLTIKN